MTSTKTTSPTSQREEHDELRRRRRIVIGVDTHKYVHVVVALDDIGGRLDSASFPANTTGYQLLINWAQGFGAVVLIFAIEGTGSYGAGLASKVRRRDVGVIEVMRTDRRDRRLRGKSDTLDAENAARTAAMISLKQVIVNAPPALREELAPLTKMALIARCAGLRPGRWTRCWPRRSTRCGRSPGAGSTWMRRSRITSRS